MKMKSIVCIIGIALFFNSCSENKKTEKVTTKIEPITKDLNYHLNNAMVNLDNNTSIYNELSKDVFLKSFGRKMLF